MKKTKLLVFAVTLGLVLGSVTAFADTSYLFSNSNGIKTSFIVIGDKAYSIGYLKNHSNEINTQVANSDGKIYYWDTDKDQLIDLFDNGTIVNDFKLHTESVGGITKYISSITYIDDSGVETKYQYDDTKNSYELNSNIYLRQVSSSAMFSGNRIFEVTVLKDGLDESIKNNAYFYRVQGNSTLVSINGSAFAQYIADSSATTLYVEILDSNQSVIGVAKVDLTSSSLQQALQVNGYAYTRAIVTSLSNASGNIVNGGLAAQAGDYIYYTNTGDKGKIYKYNVSNQDQNEVCEDNARYINVVTDEDVPGNYIIYYSNLSDKNKIYKVNSDGSGRTKLCDDLSSYVTYYNDNIYYTNHSDGGRLYKLSKDGNNAVKGTDGKLHGVPVSSADYSNINNVTVYDEAEYINVANNTIYYCNNSDNGYIYSMGINGSGRVALGHEKAKFLNIEGKYAYYYNGQGKLKKLQIQMDNGTVPLGKVGSEVSINHVTYNKKTNSIASTTPDKTSVVNVAGDTIYYRSDLGGKALYSISTDGSGQNKVMDDSFDLVNILGNYIYYLKSSKVYLLDLSSVSGSSKKIAGTAVSKVKQTLTISKVDNISISSDDGTIDTEKQELTTKHKKVPALMSDGSIMELTVIWDTSSYTTKNGFVVFKGNLIGYNKTITCTVSLKSKALDASQIAVMNNPGKTSDTVTVTGLSSGDIIKVYSDSTGKKLLGTSTVPSGSTSTVITLSGSKVLGPSAGTIYVTVTKSGRGESDVTPKAYGVEGSNSSSGTDFKVSNRPNYINATEHDKVDGWNLNPNDIIKVYADQGCTRILGPVDGSTVGSDKTVTIDLGSANALNDTDGNRFVWITTTTPGKGESSPVKIAYDAEVWVNSIGITRRDGTSTSQRIAIPSSGATSQQIQYIATVRDKNGQTIAGENVTWKIDPDPTQGVSINQTTGVLTVTENANANTSFTVTATSASNTDVKNSVTVYLGEKVATITDTGSTYDAANGILTISGTNILTQPVDSKSPFNPDKINIGDYTLSGSYGWNTNTVTDTAGYFTSTTSSAVTIYLAGVDQEKVDAIILNAIANNKGSDNKYALLGAADNWDGQGSSSAQLSNSDITVSSVPPSIAAASYDSTSSTLTITAKNIGTGDFQPSKFSINGVKFVSADSKATITKGSTDSNGQTIVTFQVNNDASQLAYINGTLDGVGSNYKLSALPSWEKYCSGTSSDMALTVNNYKGPDLTHATITYEPSTGKLKVTGASGLRHVSGQSFDIDATKFTFSNGSSSFTLSGSTQNVQVNDNASFDLTLAGVDKAKLYSLIGDAGSIKLSVAADWNGTDSAHNDVIAFTATIGSPQIDSSIPAQYDASTGKLVITGSNFRNLPITTGNFTVYDNIDSTNDRLVLTSDSAQVDSDTQATITISGIDRAKINALLKPNGLVGKLDVTSNWLGGKGNAVTALSINVNNYYKGPVFNSAAYDADSGKITITGTGLRTAANGTSTSKAVLDYTKLGVSVGSGNPYYFTDDIVSEQIIDDTSAVIILGPSNRSKLNAMFTAPEGGTAKSSSNGSYHISAMAGWNVDGASPYTNMTFEIDNYNYPQITDAEYDLSSHILTLTGKGFRSYDGADNDVTVGKFEIYAGAKKYQIQHAGDVDIDSDTKIVITLNNSDDINGFSGIFNKTGGSDTNGNTYYIHTVAIGSNDSAGGANWNGTNSVAQGQKAVTVQN